MIVPTPGIPIDGFASKEIAMFQMSMQFFDQCWPEILACLTVKSAALCTDTSNMAGPWVDNVAEAGYVLGIAIGFDLQSDPGTGASVSISAPGWRADACGEMNWQSVMSSPRAHRMEMHT